MTTTATKITVTSLEGRVGVDRESGYPLIYQRYQVQRAGGEPHVVEVEVSGDSGTPQSERCDCRGYKYRRDCSHITAVYEAGVLGCQWE